MKHRETNFYEDLQKYDKLLSQDFNFESTEVNLERCDINNHKARYPISKQINGCMTCLKKSWACL